MRPDAWQRVKAEKARELAGLVSQGALAGQGRGKGLRVQKSPFYDRLGEPVPVNPDWAREYQVVRAKLRSIFQQIDSRGIQ